MKKPRIRQAGFGLVTAIFLLVVMAGLAVAMVALTMAQQSSSGLDILGARAYQAARSGAEWGLLRRTLNSANCAAASSFSFPAAATSLNGFTVTVNCAATSNGGVLITSTACNATQCVANSTSPDYVQRVVQARAQ